MRSGTRGLIIIQIFWIVHWIIKHFKFRIPGNHYTRKTNVDTFSICILISYSLYIQYFSDRRSVFIWRNIMFIKNLLMFLRISQLHLRHSNITTRQYCIILLRTPNCLIARGYMNRNYMCYAIYYFVMEIIYYVYCGTV